MLYVIYNQDGSLKATNLNEIITQGSTTTKLFVYVAGYDTSTHNAIAYCVLPNHTSSAVDGEAETQTIDGTPYSGWTFALTQDETYYYGEMKMSIKVYVAGTDTILFTIPVALTINKTGFVANSTNITITQYTNLIDSLNKKQDKYAVSNLRVYSTLALAEEDLENLAENQLFYVVATKITYKKTSDSYVVFDYPHFPIVDYDSTDTVSSIYNKLLPMGLFTNAGWIRQTSLSGTVDFVKMTYTSIPDQTITIEIISLDTATIQKVNNVSASTYWGNLSFTTSNLTCNTPTTNTEVANKQYVDSNSSCLYKHSLEMEISFSTTNSFNIDLIITSTSATEIESTQELDEVLDEAIIVRGSFVLNQEYHCRVIELYYNGQDLHILYCNLDRQNEIDDEIITDFDNFDDSVVKL